MINIKKLITHCISVVTILSISISAHAAECDSVNNELSSKFRFIGSWDSDGTPLYLENKSDDVSSALIDYVNAALPESVKVPGNNDEYFGDDVQLNTELKEKSKVFLTMVHEGAGWTNTLGFYTYNIANPPQDVYDIDSLVVIFPNVTQPGTIQPGNKVLLGEFPAETGIGYFLIAQGWVGDTICLASHMVFTDTHLNTFTTPEYQQQTILLNYETEDQILLCFEDIQRPGGDNDFNDAVFYVTAEPGAIDTTNIPVIPTAQLSGDTTLCDENALAELAFRFTGKAPWSITITNGTEEQTVAEISQSSYILETSLKDSIWIKTFSDSRKSGIKSGYAIVNVSKPGTSLSGEVALCGDEESDNGFLIELEGIAPFSLTYTINGEELTVENLMENQYELTAEVGQEIQLVSMSDKYCTGTVLGVETTATVRSLSSPTLSIDGSSAICGNKTVTSLDLLLDGEGPWTINYLIGEEEYSLEVVTAEYHLDLDELGLVQFQSVSDVNCTVLLTESIDIQPKPLPAAIMADFESNCGDDVATINMSFEGEGPWMLEYMLNGELKSMESAEAVAELVFEENSLFELVSLRDAFCETDLEGAQEVVLLETLTAEIIADTTICGDDKTNSVDLKLGGEGPWTINYLIGEEEYSLEVATPEYHLDFEKIGVVQFQSVSDVNCTLQLTESIDLQHKELPTAIMADFESSCGDDVATINMSFEGEGPWMLEYMLNGELKSMESAEAVAELLIEENSLFELVSLRDAFCETDLEGTQEVVLLETPTAIISGNNSICAEEEAPVQIVLTGIAPFNVVYSDGENEVSVAAEENNFEFTTNEFKTYTLVSVSDANCEGTVEGSATISDGSGDLNVEIDTDENSCFGEDISLTLIGDTEGLTIKWTTEGQGTLQNTDQINTVYTPAENETGGVVFFAEVTNGCAIKTISKTVTIIEELTAEFNVSPEKDHLTNAQITFTPDHSGYDGYNWDFGDETTSTASIASTEYTTGGKYEVNLTVTLEGCEASGSVELEVLSKDELFIPNAFHPYAQNSENQVVKVYGNNIENNDFFFKIVNRWGKVMYETNSFNEANTVGWGGVNNNTGEDLEMNVFTYIVRGKFIEGDSFERAGTVTQVK